MIARKRKRARVREVRERERERESQCVRERKDIECGSIEVDRLKNWKTKKK